jgi:hypothetical protein
MHFFFYLINLFFIFTIIKSQKTVEINFYRNISYKSDTDFSGLIKNKIYTTLIVGSFQKIINLQIVFYKPYFSLSSIDVENSTSLRRLEPNFSFYSKSEFNYAQKSEEKIKINDKITIDDFKFISDGFGGGNIGLSLNIENNELSDFSFIKELLRKKLINNYDIKLLYDKNNLSKGKIIFGSTPPYTEPMHIEKNSIFCFKIDRIIYQDEDYTTEIGIDFESGGIMAPGKIYIKIANFFQPYLDNKICKYVFLSSNYDKSFFCDESFNDFEKFDKIYFSLNDFDFKYSFVLEGKDLFVKVKDGYLFVLRTYIYSAVDKWVLGLPFFSKYPVSLNFHKRLIGFDINKNITDTKQNNNNNSILPWALFGSLAVILIIIIAVNLYFFVFKKKRKISANELDEDIIYNKKIDEDNNLGI